MFRLRLASPMPAQWSAGTTVSVDLTVVTERARWIPQVNKKGEKDSMMIKVTAHNPLLSGPAQGVSVHCEPSKPVIDPLTGRATISITLKGTSQFLCLESVLKQRCSLVSNIVSHRFRVKAGSAEARHPADGVTFITPSIPFGKTSPHGSSQVARSRPDLLARSIYTIKNFQIVCCEKMQLLDPDSPGLGQVVWDAGLVLAAYIAETFGSNVVEKSLKGCNIIELGAGPGLPGIVAACCGAKTVLTDQPPLVDEICAPNAEANRTLVERSKKGGSIQFAELAWEDIKSGKEKDNWGLPPLVLDCVDNNTMILGADIVFDELHFGILGETVSALLDASIANGGGIKDKGHGKTQDKKKKKGLKSINTDKVFPCAIFSYRVRERCARHGCDSHLFFEHLESLGMAVEELVLTGIAAEFQKASEKITPKASQKIRVMRVTKLPS
eukprot:m.86877 g.86877  ORF g.86877 m.86877 type:complete len:441 (-) comp13075_c0_seq8:86-1408(-)